MTQPSLNHTFDTSLIDLSPSQAQDSFSTTESVPSDDNREALATTTAASVPAPLRVSTPKFEEASTTGRKMPTRYVPTVDAYDAWAEVYDSDGNVLQAIDDYELGTGGIMAQFIEVLNAKKDREHSTLLVDLGCGTGRNTIALMKQDWNTDLRVNITGIDASAGMLSKAAEKLQTTQEALPADARSQRTFNLLQHDFLDPADATRPPTPLPESSPQRQFDGLITTLVLEHFPLPAFFAVLASLVRPGGVALLTNMHEDMGTRSQAGFVSQDERTGEAIKVRGTSWVHGVGETVEAANAAGFQIVGEVRETEVGDDLITRGVVSERARKWVGVRVWYGMILSRVG